MMTPKSDSVMTEWTAIVSEDTKESIASARALNVRSGDAMMNNMDQVVQAQEAIARSRDLISALTPKEKLS